ncbi:MAG: Asp-tRNA(Asn)/Glu-tRNA(Gln) amidotransferase subunit GatC [Rhodobacteraceae bacterium]|nr:Asp-tRNA(Asn)/Glu-tRNA(Gln) amidotransferase subunit GatC [Paracoccaceae bacterium]
MSEIDIETARRVAHLARIEVAEEALPGLARELSAILTFMEQLGEVDVEGVEPMTSVTPMRLKRRADAVTDGFYPERILANAPDAREGFFAVPKVVE